MSARVPFLALLTAGLMGTGLSAGTPQNCQGGVISARVRAAQKVGAVVVRTGLYAVCGLPTGFALDRFWLSKALTDHHADMAQMPARIGAACGFVSGSCLVAGGKTACWGDCDDAPEAPPVAETPQCPYMKKQAEKKEPPAAQAELPGSVLDNLEKLLKAQKVFEKGDSLRRQGKVQKARACFEQVQNLVPGSRMDAQAAEQMEQMAGKDKPAGAAIESEEQEEPAAKPEARKPAKAHDPARVGELLEKCREAFADGDYDQAEHLMLKATWKLHQLQRSKDESAPVTTQEESECPWKYCPCEPAPNKPGCKAAPNVEAKVEELLSACHKALAAEHYDEAVDLARKALELDPACVAADGLIYKTHMLIHLEEKAGKDCLKGAADSSPHSIPQDYFPGCVDEPDPKDAAWPRPEAVKSKHVDNLKEINGRSWDPYSSEPAMELEEPCEDSSDRPQSVCPANSGPALELEELCEEPKVSRESRCPVSPARDFLVPPTPVLALTDDVKATTCSVDATGFCMILRSMIEGACVELDQTKPSSVRIRCELQLGDKKWRVLGDSSSSGRLQLTFEVDSQVEIDYSDDPDVLIRGLSGGACDEEAEAGPDRK